MKAARTALLIAPLVLAACGSELGPLPSEESPASQPASTSPSLEDILLENDGVLDVQPAKVAGNFGLATLEEPAPASIARVVLSPRETELYFDRSDNEGSWLMVQLFFPGTLAELLPNIVDEPRALVTDEDDDAAASGFVCSRVGGSVYDRRMGEATLIYLGEIDSHHHYELRALADGADARARFRL